MEIIVIEGKQFNVRLLFVIPLKSSGSKKYTR